MARRCVFTGKSPLVGNTVSHAHNKAKMRQLPNIQNKRIFVSELGRFVHVHLSTRALRSISKVGLLAFMKKNNLNLKDVEV